MRIILVSLLLSVLAAASTYAIARERYFSPGDPKAPCGGIAECVAPGVSYTPDGGVYAPEGRGYPLSFYDEPSRTFSVIDYLADSLICLAVIYPLAYLISMSTRKKYDNQAA